MQTATVVCAFHDRSVSIPVEAAGRLRVASPAGPAGFCGVAIHAILSP
jgi:hypothetical protein